MIVPYYYSHCLFQFKVYELLSNKKAIITGANQGLGLEIARKFVLAGADLMICARNGNMLEVARNELIKLASAGQKIEFQTADISLESDAKKIVDQTLKLFGGCHILVNNAGIYGPKGETELEDLTDQEKQEMTEFLSKG